MQLVKSLILVLVFNSFDFLFNLIITGMISCYSFIFIYTCESDLGENNMKEIGMNCNLASQVRKLVY